MSKKWALVENRQITLVIEGLPRVWRNIMALDELEPDELADLSWAGHAGCFFTQVIDEAPSIDRETEYLEGPTMVLEGPTVRALYKTVKHPKTLTLRERVLLDVQQIPITNL